MPPSCSDIDWSSMIVTAPPVAGAVTASASVTRSSSPIDRVPDSGEKPATSLFGSDWFSARNPAFANSACCSGFCRNFLNSLAAVICSSVSQSPASEAIG